MFGSLGFGEIAFVLILALLLFGPKRLPEIGKTLGKGLAEFRRASNDLKRTLEREVEIDAADQRAASRAVAPPAATAPVAASALPDGEVAAPTEPESTDPSSPNTD